VSFTLVDPATGRLSRVRAYSGTVDNPMDLRSFPFDMDRIEMRFFTSSNYITYDGERGGNVPKGRSYRLRQIQDASEGKWLAVKWSGLIGEWTLHGISSKIQESATGDGTFDYTNIPISFHVTRNSGFYFWKALLPLYLLTALSMTTFQFETDNLEARLSQVMTAFLAAFAMLYVVGAALPKTDFLTKIDTVIVLTTVSLAFTGLASSALAQVHHDSGEEVAKQCNLILVASLISMYVVANLSIFVPPCIRQRQGVRRLVGHKRLPRNHIEAETSDAETNGDLPPTVEPGCDYYTLDDVLRGRV
jgi:hypothetical protein